MNKESLAESQTVIVDRGPHEASVVGSVARALVFIQLESEYILTGVETVARLWGEWVVLNRGKSSAKHPFSSITGSAVNVSPLVRGFKPDNPGAV